MGGPDASIARLRGGFVGALAGSTTVAAHAMAGGTVPTGSVVVLLVLAFATVGAVAARQRVGRVMPLALLIGGGQLLGHLILVAACHHHGPVWSAAMLAAHALGALACAFLIAFTEHCCRRGTSTLTRFLVRVIGADAVREEEIHTVDPWWRRPGPVLRSPIASAVTTRGPPLPAVS